MSVCVYTLFCSTTLDLLSHLVYSGQRACALPVLIIVSPQWTPVPQGTFLPQSIIQNVILLTFLALKSIEIHGGLHGRLVLKAPSCPAAAALQWMCGPPLLCSQKQNVSKRKSTSCDGCGRPASADHSLIYLVSCSPFFNFFFLSFLRKAGLLFWKAKKEGHSSFFPRHYSPSNSPFPFLQS